VVLRGGDELLAPVVITACHPKITFLRQIDRHELPEAFVDDIEHWSSRSGVVKINLAVSRLPTLAGEPEWKDFSGGFEIAPSIDQLERSFEEARAGRPATLPFSDGVIPTTLDPSLAPEGAHVVSLFTQWVPHTWSEEPHRDELEAYADRVVQAYEETAPGFRESIVARQVIGPYDMETEWNLIGGNIFHGELSADQLFHMRPAPGVRRLPDADRGLVPVLQRDARGRRRFRHPCIQLRARDPQGPQAPEEASMKEPYSFTFYNRVLVPALALLAADRRGGLHELGPVQPHADPDAVRRRRTRVLAPWSSTSGCGTWPSNARSRSPVRTPRASRSC
jgi:hypothetical protein